VALKYRKIIADNLKKAGWSLGWVSPVDSQGEQSGSLMHIAVTENVTLCAPSEKLTAFVELTWLIRG
jgi:hypothetical protein